MAVVEHKFDVYARRRVVYDYRSSGPNSLGDVRLFSTQATHTPHMMEKYFSVSILERLSLVKLGYSVRSVSVDMPSRTEQTL